MLIYKSIHKPFKTRAWAEILTREATSPVFPLLAPRIRPYLLAGTLFATASAVMYVGDAALLRYGLSWALVSLLVVVAAANLWGTRPALLVLALSVLYGAVVVPSVLPPPTTSHPFWQAMLVRTVLFSVCGATTIWLTRRARQMHEKAERRREVVTALRSMILPDTLAEAPGYDLASVYRPVRREEEVGGDFYDFYRIDENRCGLLIGDVMGKGKEAAASTALLRYSVRAFTSAGARPAQVLRQLESLIETQELQFETASLFLGFLDTQTGMLCYANAGHEPPLLRRAHGEELILDATGPILGTRFGVSYEEKAVVLGPRDALLLMTDGVTEARNAQGDFLERDGASLLLRAALHAPSSRKSLALMDTALMTYMGAHQSDDIALLLLRNTAELTRFPASSAV